MKYVIGAIQWKLTRAPYPLIRLCWQQQNTAHWADHQWKAELLDNLTRLRTFIPDTGTHLPEWPSQEEPGSGLTASAPVSDASAPACTNGVWPPLRPVNVAQKNKLSTMLSSNVQPTDLLMDGTAWQFWTMRQSNGCSTPAPRSRSLSRLGNQRGRRVFWEGPKIFKLLYVQHIFQDERKVF